MTERLDNPPPKNSLPPDRSESAGASTTAAASATGGSTAAQSPAITDAAPRASLLRLGGHLPVVALITAATLLAEGQGVLRVGFLSDDLILLSYFDSGVAGAFNPVFWMHRPTGLTLQWLLHQMFGFSAPAHQAAIVVIQLAAGLLLYLLALTLSRGHRLWSALVAALFVVYPLDEVVPWVTFAPQRFAMVLWLGATSLLLRSQGRFRFTSRVVAVLALAFVVLSNEMYLPLTALTALLLLARSPGGSAGRRPWGTAVATGAVVVGYLLWRFVIASRLTGAVDRRAGHFDLEWRHWFQQAVQGFEAPLLRAWSFSNTGDPFDLAREGRARILAVALLVGGVAAIASWLLARRTERPATLRAAAGGILAGLVLMGFAMLPFLPTKSDLHYFMLTATRNHYSINLGASVVLVSVVLLLAAVLTHAFLLSPRWSALLFGLLCVPPLVLGVLDHRRVSRQYAELSDAERYLACAIRRAAPSLKPETYVLLTGMGIYPSPLQPLDAEWTITGLLQLMYHDPSLRGTAQVEGALTDDCIGLLAVSPPGSAEVRQALRHLVVLQYGREGFRPSPRLPQSLVRLGLPSKAGSPDRIESSPRPSAFMEEYLCGCRDGAWPAPPIAPVRVGESMTVGTFDPAGAVFVLKKSNTTGGPELSFSFGPAGGHPVVGDWTGCGRDSVGVFKDGVFTLAASIDKPEPLFTFRFGHTTDLPVAGDWDGDGVDTVGVFRDGLFVLTSSSERPVRVARFRLGQKGDIPLVGDWDGDGFDTVGIYRPSDGGFFVARRAGKVIGDWFSLGEGGGVPVIGDWDGDGIETVAMRRDNSLLFSNKNSRGFADLRIGIESEGYLIAGHWN